MTRMKTLAFGFVSLLLCVACTTDAQAQWQPRGSIQGIPVWRDTMTGLDWTVTLGQVPSADWGKQARKRVAPLGFRLPSFEELQTMYNLHNGGGVLQIRTGPYDWYETSDPNILGCAWINGFQTPKMRQGIGNNYVIGVR